MRMRSLGVAVAAAGLVAAAPAPVDPGADRFGGDGLGADSLGGEGLGDGLGGVEGGGVVPDGVPDRGPVLSEPIERGEVVLAGRSSRRPVRKAVDGDTGDWVATPSRIGGASVWGAGEHVHTDFLFDAHGADDGGDRDRLEQFAGALYLEDRAARLDQVLRTSGSQLGVPEPLGAPDEYGDVDGGLEVGDLREVRWAADRSGRRLALLARLTTLTDPAELGVLVLADRTAAAPAGGPVDIGLGTGLTTRRYDRAVLLTADGTAGRDLGTGSALELRRAEVAVSAEQWDNTLEAALPTGALATTPGRRGQLDVAVVAGRMEDDGSFTPLNAAYRHAEPLEIWNDRRQALDLLGGTVDAFSSGPIAVADLAGGRTQPMAHLGPGYHERQFRSSAAVSTESGRDGIWQPYGLHVPTAHRPGRPLPATYWLHYRGGKAHSGTVINPRLTTQLGEEPGHLVVFPHGRGTSEWYVTESHLDVLEVMADAEALVEVDPRRRYVSGYSMGGYGAWLFATLYPDTFAAGFVQSGAVTQGLWAGGGPDEEPDPFLGRGWMEANDGDARAQLTYRALPNLRHVPFAIDHGTFDELVPITGIERMAARLAALGYAHRLTRLVGYEHFSQAVVDEWADGAAYLSRHRIDPNPRQVTYTVVPVLTWAVNHVDPPAGATFDFRPDGAYWVDEVEPRDVPLADEQTGRPVDSASATVQATSQAIPAPSEVPVVDTGVVSPPGHSTPYVRSGLRYEALPGDPRPSPAVANRVVLDLANVASVAVDADRAALSPADPAGLVVTTDGPAVVRLPGVADPDRWAAAEVVAGDAEVGVDGGVVVVTVPGAGRVELRAG